MHPSGYKLFADEWSQNAEGSISPIFAE